MTSTRDWPSRPCDRPPSSATGSTRSSPGTSRRRGCSRCAAPSPPGSSATSTTSGRPWPSSWRRARGCGLGRRGGSPHAGATSNDSTGMRRVELSMAAAMGTADRLHRVGVLPAPASDLAFVAFPWAVSAPHAAGSRLGAGPRQRDLPRRAAGHDPGLARGGGPQTGPQGCRSRGGQRRGGPGGHGSNHAATPQERFDGMTDPVTELDSEPTVVLSDVRDEALSVDEVLALVRHPACGGIALFVGRRARPRPRRVGHGARLLGPPQRGRRPCARVLPRGRRPAPGARVAAVHRVGAPRDRRPRRRRRGGPRRTAARRSTRAATSSTPSRPTVPIWKHQQFADGCDEWVGLP